MLTIKLADCYFLGQQKGKMLLISIFLLIELRVMRMPIVIKPNATKNDSLLKTNQSILYCAVEFHFLAKISSDRDDKLFKKLGASDCSRCW